MEKTEYEYMLMGAQDLKLWIGDRNNFCLFYSIYFISMITFSLGIKVKDLLSKNIWPLEGIMVGSVIFSLIMRGINENITKYNKVIMICIAIIISSIISKKRKSFWECTVDEPSCELRTDIMITAFITSGVLNIVWYIPIILTMALNRGELTLNCISIISYFESVFLWERFNQLYDLGYETVMKKH